MKKDGKSFEKDGLRSTSVTKLKIFALTMLLYICSIGVSTKASTSEITDLPKISGSTQDIEKVSGRVVDETGEPLPGATVKVKGAAIGVITDFDGNYLIKNVPREATLVVTFMGMKTAELKVEARSVIDIVLQEDAIALDEVTTIGYITMKKKDMTGSVASISAKQITRIPANDIKASLVSIPGIRVDGDKIRIRGTRSVHARNEPLIILDGMPYYETIGSIDPGDVASIDVLKDASSTSLYGSQGANGVIIITTKKSVKGKTTINYDAFAGWGVTNWRSFKPMNASEYTDFMREAYRAAGTWHSEADDSKVFLGNEIANMGKVDENWAGKYLDKKRFWTNHTLTIASGSNKTQYKVSLNYKNDEGRLEGVRNHNYFLTTDINHQVIDRLRIGVSNRLYHNKKRVKPDPLGGLITMSPLVPIYNEDGSYNIAPTGDPYVKNPFLNTNDDYYLDKTDEWKAFIKLYAEIDVWDGLTFKTNFSYNAGFSSRGYYYDSRSTGYNDVRNVAGNHNNRIANVAWNNILNYRKEFGSIHAIDVFGVFELQNSTLNNAGMSGKDQELPLYLWHNMGRLMDSKSLSSSFERTQMLSYVGRAHYTLMDKYMATITVRQDGASQLSKDNRWQLFDSYAVAWRASEESFLRDVDFLSNLKLRASYGKTGNHSIAAYATLGSLHNSYTTFYGSNGEVHFVGLEPSVRPTPNLKWERNKMLNLGVDFAFLKGRIHGTFDYYLSRTDNLLNKRKLPYTSGFNYAWENIGKTENEGYEVALSTIPVETKDFKLGVNFTYYRNKEQLIELYDPKLKADIQNKWWIGYPIDGIHYDLEQIGIWQQNEADVAALYGQRPGEVKVRDRDGNSKINGEDRKILGTNRPDWTGSIQLTADYKNFDFSVDCYGEVGAMIFDSYSTSTWASQMGRWNSVKVDYWTPENPTNKHPRPIAGQGATHINAIGYKNNDFFAIRSLTLGYTLPKSLMTKVIKETRFYFTANEPYKYMRYQRQGGITFNESFYLLGVNIKL